MNPTSVDMKDRLEESAIALGTFGTDLFIGTMPPTPDANITIKDTTNKPPELNYEIDRPGIQVLVREVKGGYLAGITKSQSVYSALHGYQGTLSGTRYILVAAAHSPMYVGKDENNRPFFSINFEVQRTTA